MTKAAILVCSTCYRTEVDRQRGLRHGWSWRPMRCGTSRSSSSCTRSPSAWPCFPRTSTSSRAISAGSSYPRTSSISIWCSARRGGRVLGVCGGYQMLGRRVADPDPERGQVRGIHDRPRRSGQDGAAVTGPVRRDHCQRWPGARWHPGLADPLAGHRPLRREGAADREHPALEPDPNAGRVDGR